MIGPPYMNFYVTDYMIDTVHLTTEEHGAYCLLIFNYWQTSGPIPKNRLAAVARLSNDRWTSVRETLLEYFVEGPDGEWIHKRIEEELRKVAKKSKQNSAAGKKSAKKREAVRKALIARAGNGRSTDVQRSLNHTDTDTDKNKRPAKDEFGNSIMSSIGEDGSLSGEPEDFPFELKEIP